MVRKFDDFGDALLHALDEILCGTSNYRPLIPASPSLCVNRSVILTIMSDHRIYWFVLHCSCGRSENRRPLQNAPQTTTGQTADHHRTWK